MIVWIGVVLFFIVQDQSDHSTDEVWPAATAVALVGIAALTLSWKLHRPLDCTSDLTLAGTYRVRFFLRIALAELPALAGFAATLVVHTWWIYPVGVAVSVPGFVRAAPSARNLAKDQAELEASGCSLSVIAALANPPPRYPSPTRP